MATHKVRRGETLSSIAKTYSVDTNLLAKVNNLNNVNNISVNQTLTIPSMRNRNTPDVTWPKKSSSTPLVKAIEGNISEIFDGCMAIGKRIGFDWIEEILQRLRTQEANESVQQKNKVPVTKQVKRSTHQQTKAVKKGSRSKKTLNDVKDKLKEALGKEPHVVTFNGVKLSENEKKQIIASVAVCEMSSDGFGSINSDQEFVGRKFGNKGIATSYSRIVHIGLSYGVIQYTQDSGSLGYVLKKMHEKNSSKFKEVFGGGDEEIANNLLVLTVDGRADLVNDATIPLSGQAYWNKIRKKDEGKELSKLANSDEDKDNKSDLPTNKEIRGKRVQPIAPTKGEAAIDIWTGVWRERFLSAGKVVDFQEVQLEVAVEKYLNPILKTAKANKLRSALGLAFAAACSIRGGPDSTLAGLVYAVANELDIELPFTSSEDERKCLEEIAKGKGKVKSLKFDEDESRRAELLLKDELGFLSEDLYDVQTYV